MRKFAIILCGWLCFLGADVYAENRCDKYKIVPNVEIENIKWTKTVVQEPLDSDSLHGLVDAELNNKMSVAVQGVFVKDGFCVYLETVKYTIGYDEFIVHIDEKYNVDSCEYNAVMNHEDKHINAFISVLNDKEDEIRNVISGLANQVMPVFVKRKSDFDSVISNFYDKIVKDEKFISVIQNVSDETTQKNNAVDETEDGHEIQQCIDENWA